MKFSSDNFLNGGNANYIDYMYSQWQKDPSSVHASWNAYFAGEESGASASFQAPPTLGKTAADSQMSQLLGLLQSGSGSVGSSADTARVADESIRLTMLLRAFMTHGHLLADVDPLKLREVYKDSPSLAKKFRFPDESLYNIMDPAQYGFTEADMEKEFHYTNPYHGSILK
jgi:2-oxoglutarate dehydrogenase E1 component